MSLRFSRFPTGFLCVSTLMLGIGLCNDAFAAPASQTVLQPPAVQTFIEQPPTPSRDRFNSPLAAGTLTLQDVLEAHKNVQPVPLPPPSLSAGSSPSATTTAPLLKPSAQSSATSLMMSQGMKDVLQKVGGVNVEPVTVNPNRVKGTASVTAPQLTQTTPTEAALPATAPDGAPYQPGQEPKNLATGQPVPSVAKTDSGIVSSGSPTCGESTEKWEKTCGDAGYPANYVGKITGETRTGCADGALHDIWITNDCVPPDGASSRTEKTDGGCGLASNNEYDTAPTSSLCAQGIASAVKGDGPWTWACSGVNGGSAAACVAPKRVPMSNGVCGDANGVAVSSAPSSDLCNSGTATEVKNTKNGWTWSCRGRGKGGVQSCIAPVTKKEVDAEPVATAPVSEKTSVKSESPKTAGGEKGDLCGAAAETITTQAPEKNLCRVGNASVVNGDGPWTWACTDNEGTTSSCRTLSLGSESDAYAPIPDAPSSAPQKPVQSVLLAKKQSPFLRPTPESTPATSAELACGLAASQPLIQAPTTELCEGGKASSVTGSGPWRWTCSNKAHHKVSCETVQSTDGACGPANGSALKSAPFSGLCAHGTPSSIEGNGPWTWVCNGTGGGSHVNCAATVAGKQSSTDGVCGAADGGSVARAPTENLCQSGIASNVSGEGPWTWACSGNNGGAVASCSANKVTATRAPGPSVNGLCGFANGVVTDIQPTEGLCGGGKVSGIVGNGPWNWSCVGENGGMTVSCTAPLTPPAPIDGNCGGANGVPTLVKPQSGLCAAGITGTVNGRGPWTWTCSGANGGNPASCVAPVAGKSGSMPSAMVVAQDSDALTAPTVSVETPASSKLVTPRLAGETSLAPLDRSTLPSLTKSKSRAAATKNLQTPKMANLSGNDVPDTIPTLPEGSLPLIPPDHVLQPAPALQEPEGTRPIAGNHLTLDPTISTILFDRGSGNIGANVVSTLDRLAAVLVSNSDVRVSLTAYADNDDSTPRDARRLSLTRALAVRDYLASRGVTQSRMDVHAEGSNTTSGYIDRVDVKVNN